MNETTFIILYIFLAVVVAQNVNKTNFHES